MSKHAKLLERILLGTADANISFDGLCILLQRLGFQMRVCAKPYRVKQVRNAILTYKLAGEEL